MTNALRSPIRFSKETRELEYRCESCALDGDGAWWPLGREFWDYAKGFRRCRACWKKRDLARIRLSRQDPEFRAKEAEYARRYYEALSYGERRAIYSKKREYHREWMRAYRERRKAA